MPTTALLHQIPEQQSYKTAARLPTARQGDSPTNKIIEEMRKLKKNFLEKTEKLDRARSHLESFTKAIEKQNSN